MASQFIEKVGLAAAKKEELYSGHKLKYAYRSMLAGAFLTMSTSVGAIAADKLNAIHPSLGSFAYAFLFAWGLIYVLFLNTELATSNMMYLTAGVYLKKINWKKALSILFYCTFFNLMGSVLVGWMFAHTSAFAHLTEQSYLTKSVITRLGKDSSLILLEGILTNIFVNIAILTYVLVKSDTAKMWIALSAIFMFVFLAQEHVIANFGSFSIVKFSVAAGQVPNFGLLNILREWGSAFVGNYIGGGLLIGLAYAWMNKDQEKYVD